MPGQSGMIAAMFMSTSTSPAAASSTSMENAFIVDPHGEELAQPPDELEDDRGGGGGRPVHDAEPEARLRPEPPRSVRAVEVRTVVMAGQRSASRSRTPPIEKTIARLGPAQSGSSAARSTQATSSAAGMTSNARCANTVPTSVAHAPRSLGMWRVSTATRASSPTRPGIVAFASSPIENAEKTCMNRGCGGGTASSITVAQANARATTETRLRPIATTSHSHSTARNASPTSLQSGPPK